MIIKKSAKSKSAIAAGKLGGNEPEIYDAIVAGAGPAGSEMAYQLATAGFDVLVLEKDRLDREKPCGGGIQLKEMLEFGELPSSVIERRIRKARIFSPSNNMMESCLKDSTHAATVKRSKYDSYLQERAMKAGALFLEEKRVSGIRRKRRCPELAEVRAGKERWFSRLVVDAAGARSNITRMLGLRKRSPELCVTYSAWMKTESFKRCGLDNAIELYFLKEMHEGYAWIFPKKDVVSVGIGATADSLSRNRINLKKILRNFIRKHPVASKKLKGRIIKEEGSTIPLGISPVLYSDSAVIVGDAGGFANIIHGGGIYQARKSAKIAAKHCIRFLKTGNHAHLKNYEKEAREFFNDYEIRWDRKIRNVLRSAKPLEILIEKGKLNRKIQDALRIILTSEKSHDKAYRIMEKKILEMIYSEMEIKTGRFRDVINSRLKKIFPLDTLIHRQANEILLNDRAKRLRACLGLLASEMFRGKKKDALNFSLIYELFHTASLVHDDIMDSSAKRRGKKTLHAKYGQSHAIIAGDLMLSKGYSLISEFSTEISNRQVLALLNIVGGTGERCCIGQSMDIRMSEGNKRRSMKDYLSMIELKTGSLIEGSLKGGAVVAGAPQKYIRIIGEFGRNLGMAFQIIDDSLDLLGGAKANKSVMNDLMQGKTTPMLVHALRNAGKKDRARIIKAVGNQKLAPEQAKEIIRIYRDCGAIEYSQKLCHGYIEEARKELIKLPPGKARDWFNELLDVMGYWSMLG